MFDGWVCCYFVFDGSVLVVVCCGLECLVGYYVMELWWLVGNVFCVMEKVWEMELFGLERVCWLGFVVCVRFVGWRVFRVLFVLLDNFCWVCG